jgi:selenocysteine lyase/cysteine desulfurase
MIELDFHDIGCDFYAAPGHKWQCGPGGTGFLYLRNQGDYLPRFWTQNSSMYTFAVAPYGNVRGTFDIAYSLQYRGQLNIPAQLALMDCCAMWEEIGRDRIQSYVCSLSSYLKKKLANTFAGAGTFFSPDLPEFITGLTSFNPFQDITDGNLITTLVNRLQEEAGYQIRYTNFHLHLGDTLETYSLRISTHLFHNTKQIDGLVDAMYDIFMEM